MLRNLSTQEPNPTYDIEVSSRDNKVIQRIVIVINSQYLLTENKLH